MTTEPINLQELNAVAALQTRRDRKYLVRERTLERLVLGLGPTHRILEIQGSHRFGYRSVYFDTASLDLHRAAATGRRCRYKVRTRTYLDSGLCMLEVKTKGGRGQTSKHRLDYDAADEARLTDEGLAFIARFIDGSVARNCLEPVLTTTYDRSTFVDLATSTRMTIDHNLACTDWTGRTVRLVGAVVETKSSGAPSPVDRWLWAAGSRPIKISKFSTGLASLHHDLPSNKWHQALRHGWVVD